MSELPEIFDDFCRGYYDGRDPNSPEPGPNRSHRYRHSFRIARAELAGRPYLAAVARIMADRAAMLDDGETY